jgi:3-phenylpropionate/cinnamic acid dioxygenase small subunit
LNMFEDWCAINSLLMRYAEYIDGARFADAAALFEHSTYRLEFPPEMGRSEDSETLEGAAAVQKLFDGIHVYPDGTTRTKHAVTNVNIELEGDTASSTCYAIVFQQTELLPLQPITGVKYIDRFERVNGEWRFVDRVLRGALLGDMSQHFPLVTPS